jgi:hypothetical protein
MCNHAIIMATVHDLGNLSFIILLDRIIIPVSSVFLELFSLHWKYVLSYPTLQADRDLGNSYEVIARVNRKFIIVMQLKLQIFHHKYAIANQGLNGDLPSRKEPVFLIAQSVAWHAHLSPQATHHWPRLKSRLRTIDCPIPTH